VGNANQLLLVRLKPEVTRARRSPTQGRPRWKEGQLVDGEEPRRFDTVFTTRTVLRTLPPQVGFPGVGLSRFPRGAQRNCPSDAKGKKGPRPLFRLGAKQGSEPLITMPQTIRFVIPLGSTDFANKGTGRNSRRQSGLDEAKRGTDRR